MTTLQRSLALVGCLVGGALVGLVGEWLTASQWGYLAVPALLAAVWLFIADPGKCACVAPEQQASPRARDEPG